MEQQNYVKSFNCKQFFIIAGGVLLFGIGGIGLALLFTEWNGKNRIK